MPAYRVTVKYKNIEKKLQITAKDEIEIYNEMQEKGMQIVSIYLEKAPMQKAPLQSEGNEHKHGGKDLLQTGDRKAGMGDAPNQGFLTPRYGKYFFTILVVLCVAFTAAFTYDNAYTITASKNEFKATIDGVRLFKALAISATLSFIFLGLVRTVLEGVSMLFNINDHLVCLRDSEKYESQK